MKTEELKSKVAELKKKLKKAGIKSSKAKFFDETFGSIKKQESIRYDNIWACYIADEYFTEQLEQFVINLNLNDER